MPVMMEQLMTVAPHTVGAEVSLAAAKCMMLDYGVGHLPVRHDGRLVGMITKRDLELAAADRLVVEVMQRNPLIVSPLDIVSDVAASMAERHADAAIVVDGGRVIGIFTATDAERALAATLRSLDARG